MTGDNGSGLRGGTFTVDDSTSTFTFQGAKFADDVSIDGTATLDQTSGKVDAQIKVTSAEGTSDVGRVVGREHRRRPGHGPRHGRGPAPQCDASRALSFVLTSHRRARSSAAIWRTTFIAGMPVTPPPPCVAEPAW